MNVLNQTFGDKYALYHGDSCDVTKGLPSDSVHLTVSSLPFSSLYIYSDSVADMGNAASDDEFFTHFQFLVKELWRITAPGRLCVMHCKDLPLYMNRDGAAGLKDFPGQIIRAFEDCDVTGDPADRWVYHSRVTIWKDPVVEMQRTKTHGLLHKNFTERCEVVRQGMPDYLVVFRKWTANELEDKQVTQQRHEGDYIGTNPPQRWRDERDYSIQVWQRYASPVWFDIDQMDTLNYELAKDSKDEKHICPLQLGVIRRCIDLWSNPGEVIFDPFGGVGSTGVCALEMQRRAALIELKDSYYKHAARHLARAELATAQTYMFTSEEVAA